ncbi:MAG: tRNA (adenosine(37)-N6)-dimethylallyltransferase MiaA [Minisyncoccia bacterium]
MKKKVLVIVGPTASGKSGLGVKLSKEFNGEIVSADSRQVYKGLDIGSGKVTKKEMQGVPHHLLDVASPKIRFSASDYKKLGDKAIEQIIKKNKLPIIVGGTGFYIDTLTSKMVLPEVPPNPKLRKTLEAKTTEALYKILQKKDQERAKNIDSKNKVRLIRALEIIEALGKVPSEQHRMLLKYDYIYVGVNPEKEVLEKLIYKRLLARLLGMIKEAKKLHRDGLTYKRMEELGLEYRYLARLLQNKLTLGHRLATGEAKKEFIEELYKEIRHYSKRQLTWFKANKKIKWFSSVEFGPIHKYLERLIGK